MGIERQLFEGALIRLSAIDPEKDAEVEARWMRDIAYLRSFGAEVAMPLSAAQLRKRYEKIEKEMETERNLFYFTIRLKSTDPEQNERLLGFVKLQWVDWTHAGAWLVLAIGDPADRRKGYGSDAMRLMLHYAFAEINMHRITFAIPEYNLAAKALAEKFGFTEEVRRRKAVVRDGREYDLVYYGLLDREWEARHD